MDDATECSKRCTDPIAGLGTHPGRARFSVGVQDVYPPVGYAELEDSIYVDTSI